ncbi:RhoGAP domain-containing protein [uncultured Legionella sp.]|uniref:RhoGAP domain-containing protein n=1 Tax=uncultured Legionella sp. TaxID=210934 RepID=UPI00262F4AAC|nr:RhoGAP domain-containing protein [uncultured Legionella sp.]
MAGNPKYSTHDIVNVIRCIARLVQDMPELLNNVGVFRLAGSKTASQALLNQLIAQNFDWMLLKEHVLVQGKIDSDCLNDILSMVSTVLKNIVLLNATDSMLAPFAKSLHAILDSDRPDKDKNPAAATLIDDFINELLLSNSIDYQRTGEILYHYCYLMHTAATYQETNKMNAHNLAIILSPHFTSELELFISDDILSITQFSISKLTPVLGLYIGDERTSEHFTVRHADKLEHLRETRSKIIDKLNEMKAANKKCTVDLMRSMMINSKELTEQIGTLEFTLQTESLTKDKKKQLKNQLEELQSNLQELNLKLMTLREQIDEMNTAHASLFDTAQKLSLSLDRLYPTTPRGKQISQSSNGVLQLGVFGPSTLKTSSEVEQSDSEESSLSFVM